MPRIGHFHPMLALAEALQARGHDVVFLTGAELHDAVSDAGFETMVAGPEFSVLVGEALQRYPETSFATPEDHQRFAYGRLFSDIRVELTIDDATRVGHRFGPDLVVSDKADFVGPLLAAILDRPNATVGLTLVLEPERLQLAAGAVARHWETAGFAPPVDAGLYRYLYLDQFPALLQRPGIADLPVVQDLRPIPLGDGTELAPDLERVGRDRPLIYVTLGTVFGDATVMSTILDGLSGLDVDVVATIGPNMAPEELGVWADNVHVRQFVPQGALLARCRLVITHGGAGSVLGPLSHRVPLVLVPLGADQQENADQVAGAGAGRILVSTDLSPNDVEYTAQAVLADDATRQCATRIGNQIAAMPHPNEVVPLLEHLSNAS